MKIIHLADVHACREHWAEVQASLDVVEASAAGVDLIAISGDLADGPLQNTERDIFDALAGRIQRLADLAPVALIYGTPSHDAPGSLEVFERLTCSFGITILRPGKTYYLGGHAGDKSRTIIRDYSIKDRDVALLFGVPEPNKKWLLANQEATGKDASDEAVRAAMRALFLGLGGMRREHAELPCVLLYHGQVSGARTGTGYKAGSGIAVSRDDLAAVGADYLALGDIHEPQQVGDLPAYYPGSIYPASWGETHKAGCNLVEIGRNILELSPFDSSMDKVDGFKFKLSRIDFPHPQRVKVAIKTGDKVSWDPPSESIAGKLVWLEYTAKRDEAVDVSFWERTIEREGALPGSRVTLNILPTEMVRAAEIAETASLREEVVIWGENSSVTIPENALKKADELILEQARGTAGAHIRIDRLVLRGAVGTWKKSKKDEIDLDLSSYGPGVLALVGGNGAGKTTLLENLHPWPCMLTRDGVLKEHFRLADSFRDLYFTDERTGWRYHAQISIRAEIASGGAEYFLSVDKGAGFEPYPGTNGRKEPYEAAIADLFGSLELYLRTAFATQRPTKYAPDLSEATKGQRKALFCELSGIDYYDELRGTAKTKGDALDREIQGLDATIAAAADVPETIARLEAEKAEAETKAERADQGAALATETGLRLRAEREGLAGTVSTLEQQAARRAQILREITDLQRAIDAEDEAVQGFRSAAAGRVEAETQLGKIGEYETELASLKAEKADVEGENRAAERAYQVAVSEARGKQDEARAILDAKRSALSRKEADLAKAEGKLSGPIVESCPTCGQRLPEDKLSDLRRAQEILSVEVGKLKREVQDARKAVSEAEAAVAAVLFPDTPVLKEYAREDRLEEVEEALAFLDRAGAETTIRKADEADVRIEEATRRIDESHDRLERLESEGLSIKATTEAVQKAKDELAFKDRELDATRASLSSLMAESAAAKATAESAARGIEAAAKRLEAQEEAKRKKDTAALELADWRILERAFGPDGIPALKLDALAPSISDEANKILSGAFGSRYQLEFRTTRIAGKGSKTKQVEDFEIFVLDTETGDEQEIATLSGGEAVWIRKALYAAFAIIRARNTGTRFQTVFLDEADGALDPESRMMYLRMLEAEHSASGRFQTIIVTHSTELQAMVEQTIDVATLGPRVSQKEKAA
jgi:exonuclease SbcC